MAGKWARRRLSDPAADTVAVVLARLVLLAAFVSLLGVFLRHWSGSEIINDVIGVFNIRTEPSLFVVCLLFVLAGALRRRFRGAHTALVALMAFSVLLDVGQVIASASNLVHGAGHGYWGLRISLPITVGVLIVGLVVFIGAALARPAFPARLAHGSRRACLAVLVGGFAISFAVTSILTFMFPGSLLGLGEKLIFSVRCTLGLFVPMHIDPILEGRTGHHWVYDVAGFLSAAAFVSALVVFFRAGRGSHFLSAEQELEVRRLLLEHGEDDSLGYFATRRDKSASFSPDGRAAVTYRVFGSVAIASADPIGERDSWRAAITAWLEECRAHSHYAMVLAASEAGGALYSKEGLRTLSIGDEAIIEVDRFSLRGQSMRQVRQAVNRVGSSGYTVRVCRHGDLPAAELAEFARLADLWRGEATERGFSMALNRFGDPADARCVLAIASDGAGQVRGFLSFVPWGERGLSLDLMRRDPTSENGVNEFMVAKLVEHAAAVGLRRISLNFAVFRSVFFEADRVGAGPFTRAADAVLGFASRFYQIETLYRSNDKYRPDWVPRLVCYGPALTAVRAGVAIGVAEGFLPLLGPRVLVGSGSRDVQNARTPDFTKQALAQEVSLRAEPRLPAERLSEQQRVRRRKLAALEGSGRPGYPPEVARTHAVAAISGVVAGETVSVCGRIRAIRDFGGVTFVAIEEDAARVQVLTEAADAEPGERDAWRRYIDLGDRVSVTGTVGTSRSGELSVILRSWEMAAKCLRPIPDARVPLADDVRARNRVLDLITNPDPVDLLYRRARGVRALREAFALRGFTEVETPMLQAIHGGAAARPFRTHINAYDMDLYLRIAPELYLKRLAVAGMGRIFEINRNFRNEGADSTHNPEFTACEAYQAHADYTAMRELTRDLILAMATAVNGAPVALRPGTGGVTEVDLTAPWPVITIHDAVARATGRRITVDTGREELAEICREHGVAAAPATPPGKLVMGLYDALVERQTEFPTFYCDFPIEVSPLARRHRADPRLAEQWDLVGFGAELGCAYTELTDPIDQRDRLVRQLVEANLVGDPEAMELDQDFVDALSYGMPPTGGLGLGVDRLIMMLTGASIRATLAFPFIRPL